MIQKAQILYFSHGGGPLPILGDASHLAMIKFMTSLSGQLRKPDQILVISAHWEEDTATLLSSENPPMFYDYYGFPKEAYDIVYPAPGSPLLAERIAALLAGSAISARLDGQRGYDHGVFIPLKMMYPAADIPVVQLSLLRGLDAPDHLALGRALQPLLSENILVIGSGFSFHNMQAFWKTDDNDSANDAFQDWLRETLSGEMPQKLRDTLLAEWEKAPSARYCHPREEHLLPLHVCAGLAGRAGKIVFDDHILNKRCLAIQW